MKVQIEARHLTELQYAAREYAEGRCTYIVESVNQATAALIEAGVRLQMRNDTQTVWANDGNFGAPVAMIEKYGIDGKKERA